MWLSYFRVNLPVVYVRVFCESFFNKILFYFLYQPTLLKSSEESEYFRIQSPPNKLFRSGLTWSALKKVERFSDIY